MRAQILAHAANPRLTADDVAEIVGCSRSHVYRVVKKFGSATRQELLDGRRNSGRRIADERIDAMVKEIVAQSPQDFGYPRPTWTRELLVKVIEDKTAISSAIRYASRDVWASAATVSLGAAAVAAAADFGVTVFGCMVTSCAALRRRLRRPRAQVP